MHDLAVIIVSTNEARWLPPCLSTVFSHAGDIEIDVVVVDNESTDGTRELVEREFPRARVVPSRNHGFSHANNRGLKTTNARFVLFLNPDTEVLDGTFAELVERLDRDRSIGLVGVKQLTPDGAVFPTIRRFPNALRAFGEAFASERFPFRATWLGERELDLERYEREFECDWTSGSFLLARREALESAGYLDERFFIFSEEADLCYRIKATGWRICHLPDMTILHHADKVGVNPKMEAQNAYSRVQYAQKHFSAPHRAVYMSALLLRYGIRAALPARNGRDARAASRRALRAMTGLEPPPFGQPPRQAVAPLDDDRPAAADSDVPKSARARQAQST
jgi:GT2 family glycosyltransferase